MDARPRDVPGPLAVFRGRAWFNWAADPCFLFLIALAGVVVTTGFARFLPWPSALGGGHGLDGLALLLGLAGFAALVAIQRWAVARTGQAELFADRIVVMHPRRPHRLVTVMLRDLDAFDDRAGDVVRLFLTRGGWAGTAGEVTVPTPSEAGRATLVDALATAGLPRVEGQPPPRRERPVADPALLTISTTPIVLGLSVAFSLAVLCVVLGAKYRLEPHEWTLLLSLLIALPAIAAVWANPRTGTVVFLPDRILLDPTGHAQPDARDLMLSWDDVVGWRPSARDYVRLVLRPGLLRRRRGDPTIPTPTPELRAAVEALLASRGVPRL